MKQLLTAIALTIALSLAMMASADNQLTVDLGGKLQGNMSWRLTRRDFTPGPTETEFDLGKKLTNNLTVFSAYRTQNGKEALGPMVAVNHKIGDSASILASYTFFAGINGTPDNQRAIISLNQPLNKRLAVGICALGSRTEGKKDYLEAGPFVTFRFSSNPVATLKIQPIQKVGGGKGINVFLSTTF